MAVNTLADLRTRCKTRFPDPNNARIADTTWNDHINVAYKHFLANADYFMEETSTTITFNTGDKFKPLPTGIFDVLNVRDTTNSAKLWPLEGWSKQIILYPDRDTFTSIPIHYRVIGNNLHLFPTASTTVTVEVYYRQEPADLVNDTDVPIIPSRYRDAIVNGALAFAWLDMGHEDRAGYYSKLFTDMVEQADAENTGVRSERYTRPQDDFYSTR